jgi:photosystem II stability/assembly factor-like uncharacterized protein
MSYPVALKYAALALVVCGVNCGGSHSGSHSAPQSPSSPEPDAGNPSNGGSLTVQPANAQAAVGGSVQFQALLGGAPDTAVKWSVQEGASAGSISATGKYTAPGSVGTYHVVAASSADASQTATATVVVTLPAGTPPALKVGVWTNISPPTVPFGQIGDNQVEAAGIAMDISNPYTLYLCEGGFNTKDFTQIPGAVWKTTDGGNTWTTPPSPDAGANPTGTTVTNLDSCVNIALDPGNPMHLYAADGVRGKTIGFWVSNDGANTWTEPQGFIAATQQPAVQDNDTYGLAVDPADFNHVLTSYHNGWTGPGQFMGNGGVLESKDGGNTWTVHNPDPGQKGLGYFIMFLSDPAQGMGNKDTWLLGTQGSGFWRTIDAGSTWTQVSTVNMAHEGAYTYYAKNGAVYVGGLYHPLRSTDNGATWTQLNILSSFNGNYTTVYGDGTTLYTQPDGFANTARPFYTSPESDGLTWAPQSVQTGGSQTFTSGPTQMVFDSSHNIMYASMHEMGVWALKVK